MAEKKTTPKKKANQADTPLPQQKKGRSKTDRSTSTTKVDDKPQAFPIVGLGASAGGLEALEEFFKHMPTDSGMAFVVVMHQAATHVSLLPELLGKCTKMSVAPIRDRMAVEQNCIYVVPPGKNVDLLAGTMHLSDVPEKHVAPLPIDYFFRSLAAERREMAVAIVLSGTGTDGTVGLSAVKGESGMVMVQSVESAKFSGMPQHAIDSGWADYVLPPDAKPKQLIAYARGPFVKAPPSVENPTPAIQQALPEILLKLRRRCGHDFSGYKPSTIGRRIERRMNIHQIEEPKHYLRFLDQHEPEADTLFRDLLIGVTSFFRDPWTFESLSREAIMPLLKEKTDDANFRVWVPGCSTGEEAYSIAILLRECMDKLKIHLHVQIFATDLDNQAIEAARIGLFPSGIGGDVSAQRLGQYFTKKDGSYRIRKELRDWLVFAPHNVIHDPPFTQLDLISCRNLLIYMQAELQKKLLTLFHYALNPGGYLLLGTSETIGGFDDLFQLLDSKAKVFRRKDAPLRANRHVQFPVVPTKADEKAERTAPPQYATTSAIRDAITGMLAAEFAPPTVVVSENGEIVHVHGRTGKFLELAPGGPPKNVVSMAREGLELDLSSALRQAARQDAPVVRENVPVKTNGDTVLINLIVQKVAEPKLIRGLLRVSFLAIAAVAPPIPEAEPSGKKSESRKAPTSRERELERELRQNRESLQHTIEELDASNEEMKSTNEELQSTNEELQSTNEELETSKEELQSLNEELQTINAEFQGKICELSTSNDDMANLLNSTDIATIFLDSALHIKRFTEPAKQIVRVIPTDIGRPLADLHSHLSHEDLVSVGKAVLKTLVPKECEVQTEDGRWLLMRIMPYRTSQDKIDGLVMTFVDIDESKRLREAASAITEQIVATVREPLLVLDGNLRVHFANQAFYTHFHVTESETLNCLIYELGNSQWDIPALRELLEEILPKDSSFDNFEVTPIIPAVGPQRMLLNARRITTAPGQPSLILLAIEEVKE